jgi:hypothetical protein
MFDITQFREDILIPAMQALQIHGEPIRELLVFTCAVESNGGTYLKQIKGNALGIYQIEPNSFTDLWYNYIIRKPDIVNMLSLNLNINRIPAPHDLISNLTLATVCCALYYQSKNAKPTSLDENELWDIYKTLYNTVDGKAEKEPSIKAYRKFIKI